MPQPKERIPHGLIQKYQSIARMLPMLGEMEEIGTPLAEVHHHWGNKVVPLDVFAQLGNSDGVKGIDCSDAIDALEQITGEKAATAKRMAGELRGLQSIIDDFRQGVGRG